jgi:hypothetical protein
MLVRDHNAALTFVPFGNSAARQIIRLSDPPFPAGERCSESSDRRAAGFRQFLGITTRIINKVRGINRMVCDATSRPPGTIE